jgi:hypothetical protein
LIAGEPETSHPPAIIKRYAMQVVQAGCVRDIGGPVGAGRPVGAISPCVERFQCRPLVDNRNREGERITGTTAGGCVSQGMRDRTRLLQVSGQGAAQRATGGSKRQAGRLAGERVGNRAATGGFGQRQADIRGVGVRATRPRQTEGLIGDGLGAERRRGLRLCVHLREQAQYHEQGGEKGEPGVR